MRFIGRISPEVLIIVKNALIPYIPELTAPKLVEALEKYDPELTNARGVKDAYYTINDAAKLIDCTVPTIYNWKRRGKIRFHKVGDKTYIPKEDIDKIIGIKNVPALPAT